NRLRLRAVYDLGPNKCTLYSSNNASALTLTNPLSLAAARTPTAGARARARAPMTKASPADAVSEGIRRLTYLSLVSKVSSELEAHLGDVQRNVAEFIVHLGRASPSVAEFDAKLKDHDFVVPDYLARTLHTVIHA
uniref:Uncharacterized protein n=1 Tax=Aegilops tauschii subsp. strangulata TaxID=200361 RepID=A0A453S853_AEGTS